MGRSHPRSQERRYAHPSDPNGDILQCLLERKSTWWPSEALWARPVLSAASHSLKTGEATDLNRRVGHSASIPNHPFLVADTA